MITKTSFNAVVLLKIFKAVRMAQKHGIAHVNNRKGNAFLAVRKFVVDNKVVFQIVDHKGNNLKAQITRAAIDLMWSDFVTPFVANFFNERLVY